MSNLYDIVSMLCTNKGISGYRMCRDIGIQPSIMSDLKSGRKKGLSAEVASKIADYFGVTVGYLLGTEEKEKPTATNDDELNEYLDMLRNRPECRMLFNLSKNATKEDVEQAVKIIEALRK